MRKDLIRTPLALSLAAIWVLAAQNPASAGPKFKKRGEVQIRAKRTKITDVKTDQAKAKANARNFAPGLFAEQFRAKTQAQVAKLTDDAIKALKKLIRVTDDDDDEKPDFFFRLAEHYREKKTQYMFRARELDEKVYQAQTEGEKAQYRARQKKYEKAERAWMVESIKMYLRIATKDRYKNYKRMDEVLFNVADMLNKAGRQDKARKFFGKLIRNFPQSKYIPDAYLSFAEYYFNAGKVEDALKLYQQVGRFPNSPIYGYAVYKQGWCWLNLKDPRRALEKFVKVIKNSGRWKGTKKSKIILVKEAKKDSVRAFAHVGRPDKAWSFFQRIGGKYANTMLQMLANLYYEQGKFLDSVLVYRKLISLFPKSKKLCTWQYAIVKGTLSGKNKSEQVKEARRLGAVYLAVKKRGGMRKTALAECRQNSSGVLRELATTWHREAQKTQNNETYAMAMLLYREYLATFPSEKDAYEMTYYYAELLFKLKRWEPAAEVYTKVVKMKPAGKYLKDAAYAAVISWRSALNVSMETQDTSRKSTKRKRRGKKGKKKVVEVRMAKPLPISDKKLKMIAAFDTYIKHVPKSDELVSIIYRKARIYYNHNHYDKAVKHFAVICTKYADDDLGEYAANLLLDSLNITKKYDQLNKWVDRFLADPRLTKLAKGSSIDPASDPDKYSFLLQLRKLKRGAQRKEAEQLQKDGHYKQCGRKYIAIANEYQEDKRWAEVLYNAALCFEAAKLIGQAISVRNTLIKVKPDHKLSQKATYMIGANYHALAWYSRASNYYEKFAKKYPGEPESAEALQNAIVFRLGRGEYKKALEDVKIFSKNYGRRRQYRNRTAAVNFSMAAVYEHRGDKAAVVRHYKQYLAKWGRHGGLDRQIQANVEIGEILWRKSCPLSKVSKGACIKVKRVRSKRDIKKKKGKRRRKKGIELRTQCGPETKMRVIVVGRSNAAKAAQKHFAKALKLFAKAKGGKGIKGKTKEDRERRIKDMKFAAATARFYQAEKMFEDFLEVKFPRGLDFSGGKSKKQKAKKKKSEKAFGKYLEDKGKKLAKTREVYQDVIKLKVAHWAIASSARIGQLFQNFADALYTAPVPKPPIPKSLYSKDAKDEFVQMFTDTYCDTLEDKASPLERKAIEGLATCLSKSTELSWYNEWSSLCEAELNQIKPAEYPIASEIRAKPGYVSFRTDRADVITEVK